MTDESDESQKATKRKRRRVLIQEEDDVSEESDEDEDEVEYKPKRSSRFSRSSSKQIPTSFTDSEIIKNLRPRNTAVKYNYDDQDSELEDQ